MCTHKRACACVLQLLLFRDRALLLGDAIMVIATEASSERIPMFMAPEDGGGLDPSFVTLTGL